MEVGELTTTEMCCGEAGREEKDGEDVPEREHGTQLSSKRSHDDSKARVGEGAHEGSHHDGAHEADATPGGEGAHEGSHHAFAATPVWTPFAGGTPVQGQPSAQSVNGGTPVHDFDSNTLAGDAEMANTAGEGAHEGPSNEGVYEEALIRGAYKGAYEGAYDDSSDDDEGDVGGEAGELSAERFLKGCLIPSRVIAKYVEGGVTGEIPIWPT